MNDAKLHSVCLSAIQRGSGIAVACDGCWSVLFDPKHRRRTR